MKETYPGKKKRTVTGLTMYRFVNTNPDSETEGRIITEVHYQSGDSSKMRVSPKRTLK